MPDGGGGVANNVYIRSEEYAWIPARLVEQDKMRAKVAIPQYDSEEKIMSDGGKAAVGFKSAMVMLNDYQNKALPLQNTGPDGTLKEVDDMVDLPYLHEVRETVNCINATAFRRLLLTFRASFFFRLGRDFVQLEKETCRCQALQSSCRYCDCSESLPMAYRLVCGKGSHVLRPKDCVGSKR